MSAPRLLDKRTINTSVANEKKQLIETGLKLARSVDALRETKVEEEGNLERFRTESIATVQKEIDNALRKRDGLLVEIKTLEKERKLIQIPLDAEWEKLKASYLKYSDQVGFLESAKETVARQIGENTLRAHELEVDRQRISEMKRITEEKLATAEQSYNSTKEEVATMRNTAQTILSSAELRETLVVQRESEFYKERDKERARLKEWEIELNKRDQETVMEQLIRSSPITKL